MRTLTIALALACAPFAASAQERPSTKPVPAAAVREVAKVQRAGTMRPNVQAALRSPALTRLRKQKSPRN